MGGKKKRQSQNSNNALPDSSESESSKDSTQTSEANKSLCPHITRSVKSSKIKRNLKENKDRNMRNVCSLCKKNKSDICKDCWICLLCGACSCGPEEEDHRLQHFKAPRTGTHYLVYQINTNMVWCMKCEKEIPMDANKNIQGCVDLINKQYNDPFGTVRQEKDDRIVNGIDSENYFKTDLQPPQHLRDVSPSRDFAMPVLNLPKIRGLINLGNTCFFNSVLQCLAQTPGLVDLLREMDVPGERFKLELDGITIDAVLEKHKSSELSDQLAQILTEVSGVLAAATGDSRTGQFVVNPRRLLDALTFRCPQFEGGEQHDAHELLRHLLDSVHMEDLRRYQKAILDHIGFSKSLDNMAEDKKQFGKKLNQKVCETIPIRPDQIFKGSLVSILQCTVCRHISKMDEPFLDLSLPVAQEKAQPPFVRRKQNCSSPVEEEQNVDVVISKYQVRNTKKMSRRMEKKNQYANKKDQAQGEPTIEEEDKKDCINGEQSDADVEDNEDNACEEQDHKTEIVESGYSSEKQNSARGSPVTTQSPEEETKHKDQNSTEFNTCQNNPDLTGTSVVPPHTDKFIEAQPLLANRAESGLGSIQELTVTIPEEVNAECTSQDSVRVNASKGSPDISSDSQHGNFQNNDLTDSKPPGNDHIDRAAMVNNWNCTGDPKSLSQDNSSVSLFASPQYGSDNVNISSKCSPKGSPLSGSHSNDNMSICTSLPRSNDNISLCNSLPENNSLLLNSPVKGQFSQREETSGSEERPESRMECQNRSSPVELGEIPKLDSGLLKLSLEEMSYARDTEYTDGIEETINVASDSPCKAVKPVVNDEPNGFVLVGEVKANKSPIPLPPPLPQFTSSYSFTHTEPTTQRNHNSFLKYKIEEGECSLQSCLNQFTTIEMLAGGNKVGCEACTERVNKGNKEGKTVYQNSTKQLLISKLPPVMIFHLKRFQVQKFSFRKISRHVHFPLVLDISPFYSLKNKEPILYSLYGVVEHSGTLHGGHYVAYVKVRSHSDQRPGSPPPGKWYYISDSRVSDVEESIVLNTQAYLLFYERIL